MSNKYLVVNLADYGNSPGFVNDFNKKCVSYKEEGSFVKFLDKDRSLLAAYPVTRVAGIFVKED